MSETTNYKLHLTDSDSERFQDWRNAMNGTEDSNMIKIDTALGEKADSSDRVYATLLAAAWEGADESNDPPYTQTIDVEGLTALQNGNINVAQYATKEEREAAREAMLGVIGQEDGKLTIVADGDMPEIDIPVCIILLG